MPSQTSLEQLRLRLDKKSKLLCSKMGCRVIPYVKLSSRVDENSGQVYPNGEIVINDEYLWLNRNNNQIMHNLIAHECSHIADPDPRGHQHDESFMRVYRKYGKGITTDPLYLGENELLTTPHYAHICPTCGRIWFYAGKPRKKRYCKLDKTQLKLIDVYKNKYLCSNWRRINNRGNKAGLKETENILKSQKQ
jgi:hypothetical protein